MAFLTCLAILFIFASINKILEYLERFPKIFIGPKVQLSHISISPNKTLKCHINFNQNGYNINNGQHKSRVKSVKQQKKKPETGSEKEKHNSVKKLKRERNLIIQKIL
ncbi:hypothetical protein RclHR1_18310001 [Rhizophagus clarus]|uniref:Secreted protein n=1 Tax=Rhizophagus clarus TaxID=94130 RepID=A0A2Z6QLR5_9GLOM|nr:hypothetical protein RclHR1_18310001 [Rhizophagus clarus]GES87998.1 hypothetical protein RCL_jg2575.t1 [Rhizophagus clarus]